MKVLSFLFLCLLISCQASDSGDKPEPRKLCPDINDCSLKGKNDVEINFNVRTALPQNFKFLLNGDAVYDSCFASRYSSVNVNIDNSKKIISVFLPQYKLEDIRADILVTDRGAFCAQDFDMVLVRDYPLEEVRLRNGQTLLRATIKN